MQAEIRQPQHYQHISVHPLSGAVGAEIHGVDLTAPVSDEVFAEIHRAFLAHLVVFFRDQTLTPGELKTFAARFGTLDIHTILKSIDGHPEILGVFTEPEDVHVYAEGWHADVTYQERPTLGAVLYALEVPAVGGDTLFSNQYLAYESLSPAMRKMLNGLSAVHSAERVYGERQSEMDIKDDMVVVDPEMARSQCCDHPVIRTHPETGRRSLFVNDHYTMRFKDMTEQESAPLLKFLLKHAIRPEFTARFKWRNGSVAIWDNRCVLHCPIADYHGHRRHMHRVVITGDRPRHV